MSKQTDRKLQVALVGAVAVLMVSAVGTILLAGMSTGVTASQSPHGNADQYVQGSPDIEIVVSDSTLDRGGESTVTVELLNAGEISVGSGDPARVTTARGVSVSAEAADDAPFEVTTDTAAVGTVTRDAPASAPITVSVPADAPAGEYELEVEVDYEYTGVYAPGSNVVGERSGTETADVTVVIDDAARFSIVDAESDAPVGGSGDLELTLENVGETAVTDATVAVEGEMFQTDSARMVGEWDPGEIKTVTYDVSVDRDAQTASQELTATVEYTDEDGIAATSQPVVSSMTPTAEQSFTVSNVESTLEVGDDGAVRMTIENDGPEAVEALIVTSTNGGELGIAGDEYAVGELDVGERETVTFETTVGASVDPGPRLLTLDVSYRNDGKRHSDVHDVTASVDARSDKFSVEIVDGTLTAGEADTLAVAVTNERDAPVSDVSAKVFVESPLTVTDDEAFIDELAQGETAVLRFEYRSSADALPKEYPVALDFQYEDKRGETRMSETYRVPVTVQSSESGGVPVSVVLASGFVAIGATGLIYRRRIR